MPKTTVDLSAMSTSELQALFEACSAEIMRREQEEREQALTEIKRLAEKAGIDLSELAPKKAKKTGDKRGQVAAKYKGPNGELWSSRGRQPAWVKEHIEKGGNLDDLLIK